MCVSSGGKEGRNGSPTLFRFWRNNRPQSSSLLFLSVFVSPPHARSLSSPWVEVRALCKSDLRAPASGWCREGGEPQPPAPRRNTDRRLPLSPPPHTQVTLKSRPSRAPKPRRNPRRAAKVREREGEGGRAGQRRRKIGLRSRSTTTSACLAHPTHHHPTPHRLPAQKQCRLPVHHLPGVQVHFYLHIDRAETEGAPKQQARQAYV